MRLFLSYWNFNKSKFQQHLILRNKVLDSDGHLSPMRPSTPPLRKGAGRAKRVLIWFLCTFGIFLYGAEQDEVTLLRWAGPPGTRPGTYEEWIKQHPYTEFSYILDRVATGDERGGTVAILTEDSIAVALADGINQLINNLQTEGYTVLSYQISGGTPETLRTFLKDLYDTDNIEGAFFIGDITVAWFEIANDFNKYGYTQFPIDLYYMDLNGTWLDTMTTGNGKFDGHEGELNPEIYIGRLMPTGMGSDTVLIKNYLRKDNAYRYDTLVLLKRALVFVDDAWRDSGPIWAFYVSMAFPDTMNYWDPETTRASVYRMKLDTEQRWVSVFAHSSPDLHQFEYHIGIDTLYDNYYSYEYDTQDPPANFYNFFACSFSRYTTNGYGGGRPLFNQSYGLGTIGSTKTGSMLDFQSFYYPLSQDKTLGEAFKDWFTFITNNGVTFNELCWHYGMTMLGDPWLKPLGHNYSIAETESDFIALNELTILTNPVSSEIHLVFSLEKSANTQIFLYDCAGRKVANILDGRVKQGHHNLRWKMVDKNGTSLPHGVYILRAKTGQKIITRKIIKI